MNRWLSIVFLALGGCAAATAATPGPAPKPSTEVKKAVAPPASRKLEFGVCHAEDLAAFVPSLWLARAASFAVGGPEPIPLGACGTSPPCFGEAGRLACRGDVLARLARSAAALALLREAVAADSEPSLPHRAMSDADIAAVASPSNGRALTALTAEPSSRAAKDTRLAELTKRIALGTITFVVAHEMYHAADNVCGVAVKPEVGKLIGDLKNLDIGHQMFCKGNIDVNEYRADECGFGAIARLAQEKSPLSTQDQRFADLASGVLATWFFLNNFRPTVAGKFPTVPPHGYLRAPFRALAFNALANPQDHRACAESAKLIVTAVQSEIRRCEAAKQPLDYDVPNLVLDLLPQKVGVAWAAAPGTPWPDDTFSCP